MLIRTLVSALALGSAPASPPVDVLDARIVHASVDAEGWLQVRLHPGLLAHGDTDRTRRIVLRAAHDAESAQVSWQPRRAINQTYRFDLSTMPDWRYLHWQVDIDD